MNKKKIVILSLMLVAIIALSSALFVACNNDTPSDDKNNTTITETEGLLIKNGDFKVIDTKATDYPRTITSWTGGKMYSSGSYKDDVTAGVISLSKAVYDANKSKWNDSDDSLYNKLVAGGRYGDDDAIKNALMVYMPEESTNSDGKKVHGPTAYGYTSTSFTLAKGSYYRLKVDVLTHKIGGANETDRGARIYLSSNTYAEFAGIDTKGEWKTYEIIIESSPVSSTSLNVMLGLGKYNAYSQTGLTTGYAVFDNLSLEKSKTTTPPKQSKAKLHTTTQWQKSSQATNSLRPPLSKFPTDVSISARLRRLLPARPTTGLWSTATAVKATKPRLLSVGTQSLTRQTGQISTQNFPARSTLRQAQILPKRNTSPQKICKTSTLQTTPAEWAATSICSLNNL